MFLSVFDLFKIGIGPSSSHTVGPMVAMCRFIEQLTERNVIQRVARVKVTLHGSLAFTGKGHGTDRAVILGLQGLRPDSLDPGDVDNNFNDSLGKSTIALAGTRAIDFAFERDVVFDYGEPLPEHTNGIAVIAFDATGQPILEEVYFSIGGGFVVSKAEFSDLAEQANEIPIVPYPFRSAHEMLEMGVASDKSIAEMKRENEHAFRTPDEVTETLKLVWSVMKDCIERGMSSEGELPGGLKVRRRASEIAASLRKDNGTNMHYEHTVMDWISLYAIAVNEENAAGGRIVTAPTNGAAGVIPAVINYYLEFCPGASEEMIEDFLLTAGAIGGIIKSNASISGAEVGCQGEVGSAAAMAAAGLSAVLGGTNEQIENAAEIAIEHHLGMTCDPIAGLVQVPCIERNAMGAVKAVNAASLALRGDGIHFVPLDSAIETMRQTGKDMLSKYKETSQGGLAVNVTEC